MITVVGVHRDAQHRFSKVPVDVVRLVAGHGVEGDAHYGVTVQHLSRMRRDPSRPNLRQVHLIAAELLDELARRGFTVRPGDLGENVTTLGIDLLALSTGTRLALGGDAVVEVTGLRNPCVQIDRFADGLLAAVIDRDAAGGIVRRAGVMGVVVTGGDVRVGDEVGLALPEGPFRPLQPV